MVRLPGWEARLASTIEGAGKLPYVLGTHDCFRMACLAVEALTGIDLWAPWAGTYRTRREALVRIVTYGGDFDGAFSRLFQTEPEDFRLSRRGDILRFDQEEPHLVVCNGKEAAGLAENGMIFIPLRRCRHVWRIG